MLAGSMNNDNANFIEISDSDDDFDFDSDDPPSTNVTSGENGEGQSVRFQDEALLGSTPSSSSRPVKNSNGQYRTLPPSFANAIDMEKARYTRGSGDRTYPHSNLSVGPRHDSERATLSSSRLGSAGLAEDAKDNNKRILPPSFSNGSTSKSTHPNVASESRMIPSRFTNGNSQRFGDNRMGTNDANGIGQPSSSRFPSSSSSLSNAQKVITEGDDDDVFVIDGPSSHRVLPSSLRGHNAANNTELANINGMQARPNLENRFLDSDERAVYQEALQNISSDKREDDLPEGVLSVSLLKHQFDQVFRKKYLWAWRKYGQKAIMGSPHTRGYYRCTSSKGCLARKQVERSRTDPKMLVITYTSEHNHACPTQGNELAGSTRSQHGENDSSSGGRSSGSGSTCSRNEKQSQPNNHQTATTKTTTSTVSTTTSISPLIVKEENTTELSDQALARYMLDMVSTTTSISPRSGGAGSAPPTYHGGWGWGGGGDCGYTGNATPEPATKVKQCDADCDDSCDNARIYISNLPPNVTVEELQELFGGIGQVGRIKQKRGYKDQWPWDIKIYADDSGENKGDACLAYEDPSAAHAAGGFYNRYDMRGNKLSVVMAEKSAPRAPTSGHV